MKALIFGSVVTMTVIFSSLAQAESIAKAQKVLGECLMTKATVVKSKDQKKGSTKTNEVVRFTITHNTYADPQSAYYENVDMAFTLPDGQCPTLGCEQSTIAKKSYDNPITAPMVNTVKIKTNTAEKVEILFQDESYSSTKLTYDFKKRTGLYESKMKINDFGGIFGIKTITDDHFAREIKDCTFSGPINLNPSQP